jgi:hypothetical protein
MYSCYGLLTHNQVHHSMGSREYFKQTFEKTQIVPRQDRGRLAFS